MIFHLFSTVVPAFPVEQVQKAISMGISKINVNTDLQLVFAGGNYTSRLALLTTARATILVSPWKPGREAIVERTRSPSGEFN